MSHGRRPHPARTTTPPQPPTAEELEAARTLAPFLKAGMAGLERSRWKPSQHTDVRNLVAPIVLAVLVEVGKTLPLAEMTAALYPDTTGEAS